MRHAFLILAHNYPEELRRLIQALDHPDNDIFIHLDAKSQLQPEEFITIPTHSKVVFVPRHEVTWGGVSQIIAELELYDVAYHSGDYRYFHLLSGVDYPLKSQDYIHQFFITHDGENFISHKKAKDTDKNITTRYQQYHLLTNTLVGKKTDIWRFIDGKICFVQRKLGIHRFKDRMLIAHHNWMSVTNEAVEHVLKKRKQIEREYRWTFCADELFFLSEMADDSALMKTLSPLGYLRYVQWAQISEKDRAPRALTMEDYATVQNPNYLFGRKFILPSSSELYDALDHEWDKQNTASK